MPQWCRWGNGLGRARTWTGVIAGLGLFLASGTGCHGPTPFGESERIDLAAVPYGYENGGVVRAALRVDAARWGRVGSKFEGVRDAAGERAAIAFAVGEFERLGGEQTPTWQDRPRSVAQFATIGQTDCIAESDNTTTFLLVLRQEGLLKFHEVMRPMFRTQYGLFDPHRTALIRELKSGEVWAVDSWVGKNGDEPLLQEYGPWRRKEGPSRTPE